MKSDNPEQIELMNFLIERTKDAKSPLKKRDLANEYKQKEGSSKRLSYFSNRLNDLIQNVGKSKTIDISTKARMMFVFGTYVRLKLLNEFRKDAYVEIDEYQRITKYRANDGSLNLEGEHMSSAKARTRKEALGCDESRIPESPKRAAVEMLDNSSKRLRTDDMEPWTYVPLEYQPLSGSIKILNHPGVQLPQEPPREPSNLKIQKLREPKREIEFLKAAGAQESACTSQIKFLKTIRSLILTLDMPTLSTLQAKIEKKLEESPDANIPNDVLIPAMELMIAKIAHYSVPILSADVKSVSLSHFLCYLQALILNSKLKGLEVLMEKIKERIKDPALKDKSIPMENVARALQDTLNNVVF